MSAQEVEAPSLQSLPPEIISRIVRLATPYLFSHDHREATLARPDLPTLKNLSLVRVFHDAAKERLLTSPVIRNEQSGRRLIAILRALPEDDGPRVRDLVVTRVGELGYDAFGEMLKVCPGLRRLWLCRLWLPIGRAEFALLVATTLQTLVLDDIGRDLALLPTILFPTSLQKLFLIGNIQSATLEAITPTSLPHLRVLSITEFWEDSRPRVLDCFDRFEGSLNLLVLDLIDFRIRPFKGTTTPILWLVIDDSRNDYFDWSTAQFSLHHIAFILDFYPARTFEKFLDKWEQNSEGNLNTANDLKRIYLSRELQEHQIAGGKKRVDDWAQRFGVELVDSKVQSALSHTFALGTIDEVVKWERKRTR